MDNLLPDTIDWARDCIRDWLGPCNSEVSDAVLERFLDRATMEHIRDLEDISHITEKAIMNYILFNV